MKKIAIYGLGNVGSGVLEMIRTQKIPVCVEAIFDRSYKKKKEIIQDIPATDEMDSIIARKDIDIHIELLGGVQLPLYILKTAIGNGKNVITANKALLAEHGYTLFNLAYQNKSKVGFEASIAGSIPIIRNLEHSFKGQGIHKLEGILNGTTNYILTRMRREKKNYETILKDAQKLGLAEADPYLDVSGYDATHKLALLASLLSGVWIDYRRIETRGIEAIDLVDVAYADRMGYRIRLLGRFEKNNHGGETILLEPVLISSEHALWDIEYEDNAIVLEADYAGPQLFKGKGAGKFPTASAVISDIHSMLEPEKAPFAEKPWKYGMPELAGNMSSRFYLRVRVFDKPGVLANLAKVLGENDISIASVHQDESHQNAPIDLTITTHQAKRSKLLLAIDQMLQNKYTYDKPIYLPIVD